MSTPRLTVDLGKIRHNAATLVGMLNGGGISVSGVTKAFLGDPLIAKAMLDGGVNSLSDSRIENIEAMRRGGIAAPMALIRSPMLSQISRVVRSANLSLNTEIEVVMALSKEAMKQGKIHEVLLMVELGDLREGILPADLKAIIHKVSQLPNIKLVGIGTNLGCRNGVSPDKYNMGELSDLAVAIEQDHQLCLRIISGGNSSNLNWFLSGVQTGRINNLRLGEAILLGREALRQRPLAGLHLDAITLVGEVIENKFKPAKPWGTIVQSSRGGLPCLTGKGSIQQAIVAIGNQDTDPTGLVPPPGLKILNASSDHLMINSGSRMLGIGDEITFQLNYSALLRAMSSAHVTRTFLGTQNIELLPDAA